MALKYKEKYIMRILSIILALFLTIGLVGCTSSDDSDVSEDMDTTVTDETVDQDDEEDDKDEETSDIVAPSVSGKLQVKGTQLCDEKGNPVQLKGVSTHGLAWFPDYVNAECFADLHSWGANIIRLAMYTDESGGYCSDGNQDELKDLVKKGVKYATDEDMYVIVDWHILSEGSPKVYQSQAEDFFKEMSKEFADNNNVIYEICNEPNNGATWSDIKSYAEDIIPIIRENDEDAIIVVGTPTWSQDVDVASEDPIEGYDNIMYTLHFYAATHKEDLRNKMTSALDKGLPIFVTEFGICDASGNGGLDIDSANTWVDLMDENGVSYCAWNLSNKDESSSIIDSSVTKTSGFTRDDLSESGKWLYDVLSNDSSDETSAETNDDEPVETEDNDDNLTDDGLKVTLSQTGTWESDGETFYNYTATIKNESGKSKDSWKITLEFNEEFNLSDSWNGEFNAKKKKLTIKNADYNGTLADGETVTDVGFIISGSANLKYQ